MKRKLNILYSNCTILDYPQGAFYRSFNLARGLADQGNRVTFITLQSKGFKFPYRKEIRDKVIIISFPSFAPRKIKKLGYSLLPVLLKTIYILTKNYDVLHSDHYRPASFLPCYLYRFFRGGLLVNEWMDFLGKGSYYDTKSLIWKFTIGPIDKWLEIYTKKKSNAVIVLSEQLKQMTINIGIPSAKILRLLGGSDTSEIKFEIDPETYRKHFNLPKEALIISFANMGIGDIDENLIALRAIKNLHKKNKNVIGIRTGKFFSKEIREKYNIGKELIEIDSVSYSEYGKLLSCADLFVLIQKENLRNNTRWPNIIGDFLAAGRPTLVVPVGDLKQCINNYPLAFLKVKNNLQDIIYSLESQSKNKNGDQFKAIRRISENEFSWFKRSVELNSFYLNMISKS